MEQRSGRAFRAAARAAAVSPSGIRDVVHRALHLQEQGRDLIRLEVGESAAPTPAEIVERAMRDAHGGHTRYTASAGEHELREAIVSKLARVNGITAQPDHVVVTVGAVQALWLALMVVCEPGDEVLIPDPGWPNYDMILAMIGARCRRYRCHPASGSLPDPQELRAAVGPRARALVINSPNNPTGMVCRPSPGAPSISQRAALATIGSSLFRCWRSGGWALPPAARSEQWEPVSCGCATPGAALAWLKASAGCSAIWSSMEDTLHQRR